MPKSNNKYPKPNGLEITKQNEKEFTFDEIIKKKKKLKNKIYNSKQYIENEITNDNFIHFAIIYESDFYSNIEKPLNIIELFTKFHQIFSSIDKKKKLTKKDFKNLKHLKDEKFKKYCEENKSYYCNSCPICTQKFDKGFNTILPCGHIFHKGCIKKWLTKESNLCPICRDKVT